MAISKKIRFEFEPLKGLDVNLSRSKKQELLKDIADYLHESVLSKIGDGESPVKGEKFPKLKKEYAKKEHGGDRTPHLELHGDLLDSIDTEVKGDKIILGVDSSEEEKADGHNQLTSKAKSWADSRDFPKRRFIPDEDQEFKRDIQAGIDSIIEDYTSENE